MNLQENIDRIKEMMEGKDRYVSRWSGDQKYEEEYPKWGNAMVKFLETEMDSYDENDDVIILFNDKNKSKTLLRYEKQREEIYWDYSLKDNVEKFIPSGYVTRHFMYAIQDFFKKHFPDYGVYRIIGANITRY
jgi:hypothetical protein